MPARYNRDAVVLVGCVMPRSWSAAWAAVERFAHARGAIPATFAWNLAQGAVVPGPSDLLIIPLGIADPPRAWYLAIAATAGSVLGGMIAWWLGAAAFETIGRPLLLTIGVSPATLARAMSLMQEYGWLFVAGSTLTPISAKVVCIAAGATGMPLGAFAGALALGRSLRYSLIAILVRETSGPLHRFAQRLHHR